MLHEVFYWVFNMSITAAFTGLIILLIRAIPQLSKRLTVFLWLIPFFRMVIPVGLNSPYSLMTLLSGWSTKTIVVYERADQLFSTMNFVQGADVYFPIKYKVNILEPIFTAAGVIWLTVAAALLLTLGVLYVTTLCGLKDARHYNGPVYLSDKVQQPAVYGILRPRIFMPASCAQKDDPLILLHEQTHIRRADNLWRLLAFVVTVIHWFNPLVWLFLKLLLADLELACDECVLSKLGQTRAKEYAQALLESREKANAFASPFGGAKIKTRIKNILSFKKLTWFSLVCTTVLLAAISYTLLTNAG